MEDYEAFVTGVFTKCIVDNYERFISKIAALNEKTNDVWSEHQLREIIYDIDKAINHLNVARSQLQKHIYTGMNTDFIYSFKSDGVAKMKGIV